MEKDESMTIEKTLKTMRAQVRLRRLHNKPAKAEKLSAAVADYERENKIITDKLRKEYDKIRF